MPEQAIAGTQIHWRYFGNGPEQALILHCGQGSGAMWRAAMTFVRDGVTAIAPDFPGHGRSGPFPDGSDVHDVGLAVAQTLAPDGAHVIGHSFGATLALRMALAAPETITRLTLIEPVLFAAAKGTPASDAFNTQEAPFRAAMQAGDHALAARLFNRIWAGVRWHDLAEDQRARMIASMPFINASQPILHDDTKDMMRAGGLESLPMPVTFLRGSETAPVIAAIHAALMARIPNATEHVIDGAGHMSVITHPADVARAIWPATAPV